MTVPYYGDEGEGPALLLLHSGGMAHQEFDVHLDAFTDRFRVLVPDLPGHGRTPLDGSLTVEALVDAARAVLDDAGVEAAHVLGSSMGGQTALALAASDPERVNRLVLFRSGFRRETKRVADELNLDDPDYWRGLGMDAWLSRVHEPQGGDEAWIDVVQRAATLPERDPGGHAIDGDELGEIGSPTLVVVGDRDPLVPVEAAVEMYERIPDSDLWIVPHAGHVVGARTFRANAFRDEVSRFLDRSSRE
jgi:3-oxoadipate enol-lactonase